MAPEAGGKSANLVFADADLAAAAAKAAFGAFYNQGQVCSANSRILVERLAHDEPVALLIRQRAPTSPAIRPAVPTATEASAGHADAGRAIATGVRAMAAWSPAATGSRSAGRMLYQVGADVTGLGADHVLHREEVFGPLVAVLAFDTEDEAVALANATEYGLAASLWTNDFSCAHRVADRLAVDSVGRPGRYALG